MTKPGYSSGWEKESIPVKERFNIQQTIQKAIDRDMELRNPNMPVLSAMMDRVVGTTKTGLPYLKSQNAEQIVAMKQSIDTMIDNIGHVEGSATAGNYRNKLTAFRASLTGALDEAAKTNPKIAALRDAEAKHSQFVAPFNKGVVGEVTKEGDMLGPRGEKLGQIPELAAETMIPSGIDGVGGARELAKKVAATQQAAGGTTSIGDLVAEHIRSKIKDQIAKSSDKSMEVGKSTTNALEQLLSNDGYGPFLREFDRNLGTDLYKGVTKELDAQRQLQLGAETARQGAKEKERNLPKRQSRILVLLAPKTWTKQKELRIDFTKVLGKVLLVSSQVQQHLKTWCKV